MDPSFLVMMEQSLEAGLKAEGMSQLFIQELATAVMRVNYGQLTSAHQFVGKCYYIFSRQFLLFLKVIISCFVKCFQVVYL